MSFNAGGSENSSQGSSQSSGYSYYNPLNESAQLGNIAGASGLAGAYTPYSGSPLSLNTNSPTTSYTPSTVASTPLTSTNLSSYMNPYTSSVINSSNNELMQQQQQQEQQNNSAATAAGAFGGSGSQVANALTGQNYALAQANMDSSLNQANYSQAQTAAQTDNAANLQAQEANQAAGLTGTGLNLTGQQLNSQDALNNYTALWNQYTNQQQYPLLAQALVNNAYGLLGNSPLSTQQSSSQNSAQGGSMQFGFAPAPT